MLYQVTLPVVFRVTESGFHLEDAVGRASLLLADYEVTDAELSGYNGEAGTDIRNMSAMARSSQSFIVEANSKLTVTHLGAEIVVEVEAADEHAAINIARDALSLFEFSAYFLAGYNSQAKTCFTGFDFEDIEPAEVSDITETLAA